MIFKFMPKTNLRTTNTVMQKSYQSKTDGYIVSVSGSLESCYLSLNQFTNFESERSVKKKCRASTNGATPKILSFLRLDHYA